MNIPVKSNKKNSQRAVVCWQVVLCSWLFLMIPTAANSEKNTLQGFGSIYASAYAKKATLKHKWLNATPMLQTSEGLVDAKNNEKIAELVLRKLNKNAPTVQDAWVQDAFTQLISGINAQARDKALVANVIIAEKAINAFATPGGLIAVNAGLIMQSHRVDELVSVLAHEVAHISQRHFSRRKNNDVTNTLIGVGGLVASALLSKKSPEAASAMAVGTQAYMLDKQLAFSREQEREADRIGMQIMQAAGFDSAAMPEFFSTLSKKNTLLGFVPEFMLTHPLTQDRLSDAILRANQSSFQPSNTYQYAQAQFFDMKWRLTALSAGANIAQIKTVADSQRVESNAAKLGLVAAYLRLGTTSAYKKAKKRLKQLHTTHAEHSLYLLMQAQLLQKTGQLKQAVAELKKAIIFYPNSRALHLMQADFLRLQGKSKEAIKLLTPFVAKNKRDVLIWQALAQNATELPITTLNQVIALKYQAEVSFWRNDLEKALVSLTKAKFLAKPYPSHRAKITKRLNEIRLIKQKFNG